MNDNHIRDYVSNMYPSSDWKTRVANMPKGQIFAIYMRDKHKKEEEITAAKKAAEQAPIHNTLF